MGTYCFPRALPEVWFVLKLLFSVPNNIRRQTVGNYKVSRECSRTFKISIIEI